jgi:hypothetical protein
MISTPFMRSSTKKLMTYFCSTSTTSDTFLEGPGQFRRDFAGIGLNGTEQSCDRSLFIWLSDSWQGTSVKESPGIKCSPCIAAVFDGFLREIHFARHKRWESLGFQAITKAMLILACQSDQNRSFQSRHLEPLFLLEARLARRSKLVSVLQNASFR